MDHQRLLWQHLATYVYKASKCDFYLFFYLLVYLFYLRWALLQVIELALCVQT